MRKSKRGRKSGKTAPRPERHILFLRDFPRELTRQVRGLASFRELPVGEMFAQVVRAGLHALREARTLEAARSYTAARRRFLDQTAPEVTAAAHALEDSLRDLDQDGPPQLAADTEVPEV